MSRSIRAPRPPLAIAFTLATTIAAHAQTLGPDFDDLYTVQNLGGVTGVPTNYGFVIFKFDDPDTLLIGGAANNPAGAAYQVGVIRDMDGHITGFDGAATLFGEAPNNDGGAAYADSGALLLVRYPTAQIGQLAPGGTTTVSVTNLVPLGVSGSPGGLTFVPDAHPGGGRLKLISYNGGNWYDLAFTPLKDGTLNITGATLEATLGGGPEQVVYVPLCSPGFNDASILQCEFGAGAVAAYATDDNSDPEPASRRVFISGLSGAEGATIDPVTGDYLFSTYGGGNRIVRVSGFAIPDCPSDWNDDGCVNSNDVFSFLDSFFGAGADYNEDGVSDSNDFFAFLSDFFAGC